MAGTAISWVVALALTLHIAVNRILREKDGVSSFRVLHPKISPKSKGRIPEQIHALKAENPYNPTTYRKGLLYKKISSVGI